MNNDFGRSPTYYNQAVEVAPNAVEDPVFGEFAWANDPWLAASIAALLLSLLFFLLSRKKPEVEETDQTLAAASAALAAASVAMAAASRNKTSE